MEASSSNGLKTLWEKEKLLVTSNFSFSHSVFKRLVLQTRKNQGLFGKGLKKKLTDGWTNGRTHRRTFARINGPCHELAGLRPVEQKIRILLFIFYIFYEYNPLVGQCGSISRCKFFFLK